MRSSMLLGVLGAAGALASPVEKRAYTTEWTIVTVTTTVTGPAPTATYAPIQAVQVSESVSSAEPQTQPPAPVKPSTTSVSVPVAPTTQAPAPVEPAPTSTEGGLLDWTSIFATSSTAAPSSTTAPAAAAPTDYQSAVLYNHNVHRSNHSANSLEWSSDLQSSAQTLAAACVYQHDTSINGGGYGQNIGYGVESSNIGVMISNLMYNNEMGYYTDMYGQATPDMTNFDLWGHFSQIVWKGTTHVGCATVVCPSLGNVDSSSSVPFTVCNYSPAGNYDGEYADNVLAPLGQAMYSA